jgi:hypothetical protein
MKLEGLSQTNRVKLTQNACDSRAQCGPAKEFPKESAVSALAWPLQKKVRRWSLTEWSSEITSENQIHNGLQPLNKYENTTQ